jgi:hypothetical protein
MLFEGIVGQLRHGTFKCTKRGRFKNFRRAGPTFGMGLFWSNVNCGCKAWAIRVFIARVPKPPRCNSSIIGFQFFEQPNTVVDLGYLLKKFIPAQLDPGIGSSSKLS